MNIYHAEEMLDAARAVGGQAGISSVGAAGVDHDGIDVVVQTPSEPAAVRLEFAERVLDYPVGVRAAFFNSPAGPWPGWSHPNHPEGPRHERRCAHPLRIGAHQVVALDAGIRRRCLPGRRRPLELRPAAPVRHQRLGFRGRRWAQAPCFRPTLPGFGGPRWCPAYWRSARGARTPYPTGGRPCAGAGTGRWAVTHRPPVTVAQPTLPAPRGGSGIPSPLGLAVPAVGLLLALMGCGPGSGSGDAKAPVEGARRIDIVAGSLVFRPGAIEITAGEEVGLTLRSADVAHDLTIDEAGFHLHVEAGESGKGGLRIDAPATYRAYCSVPGHRAAGMEIVLTVTAKVSP